MSGFMGRGMSIRMLAALTGQKMILPFYHTVSDTPLPHLVHLLPVRNVKTFIDDMDFFLKHFTPIDAGEMVRIVREKSHLDKPVFHLSFDDGLKEIATTVAPLLKEKGVPATFFVNTSFIGNKGIFYRFRASLLIENIPRVEMPVLNSIRAMLRENGIIGATLRQQLLAVRYSQRSLLEEVASMMGVGSGEYLSGHEIYLDQDDIVRLRGQGFTIGAHSADHPEYRDLELEEQVRQTETSLEGVRSPGNDAPALFSFPFSDEGVPAEFFSRIFRPAGRVDLSFGISGLKKDIPGHLHRIPMETGDDTASEIIRGEYVYYLLKGVIRKNRIHRQ